MENFVQIDSLVDDAAEVAAEAVCPCGCGMCFCIRPPVNDSGSEDIGTAD